MTTPVVVTPTGVDLQKMKISVLLCCNTHDPPLDGARSPRTNADTISVFPPVLRYSPLKVKQTRKFVFMCNEFNSFRL